MENSDHHESRDVVVRVSTGRVEDEKTPLAASMFSMSYIGSADQTGPEARRALDSPSKRIVPFEGNLELLLDPTRNHARRVLLCGLGGKVEIASDTPEKKP